MHLQYTIFFDREKQAGGGNVKKPLPVRRGGAFGMLRNVTAHPRKQKRRAPLRTGSSVTLVEQVTGIEPALSAWEAEVLPLHHTCTVDL